MFWLRKEIKIWGILPNGIPSENQEAQLFDLELASQIASIKVSRTQGCIEIAPDHIWEAESVYQGSCWITFFAAVLDQVHPHSYGRKARGAKVLDKLVKKNHEVSYYEWNQLLTNENLPLSNIKQSQRIINSYPSLKTLSKDGLPNFS